MNVIEKTIIRLKTENGVPVIQRDQKAVNPLICFVGPHRNGNEKDHGGSTELTAEEWITGEKNAGGEGALIAFSHAAAKGVHIHSFSIWMPWSQDRQGVDYSDSDTAIQEVLSRDPQGMIIPRINLSSPYRWRQAHPEELMAWDRNGEISHQVVQKDYENVETVESVASEKWRLEAEQNLDRLIEHLEEQFGDRIVGYHLCGQNTHEWFLMSSFKEGDLTCSEPAFRNAWRKWLKIKYSDLHAFRKAWNDSTVEFEKVDLPGREERMSASCGFFRDPAREQKLIDFHEYQSVSVVEAIERFARVVKKRTEKLVLAFYGYSFELARFPHGSQQTGHLALGRLLKCSDIDIICSPTAYFDRDPGGFGGFMSAVDSAVLHGKLWANEDDTRTHLATQKQDQRNVLESSRNTECVHQRNFAHLYTHRVTCWHMDLHGTGWLGEESTWRNIGKLKSIYDRLLANPKPYAPEVAVIIDEKSCYHLTQKPEPINQSLMFEMRKSIYRMGAPCGFYLLEDLAAGIVPRKKMYVFLNCFAMTRVERQAIEKQCVGSTCVFFYGNGLIESDLKVENMNEILSVEVQMPDQPVDDVIRVEPHPLLSGISSFGTQKKLTPVFSPHGDGFEVLGVYEGSKLPAVWMTRGSRTNVYIGSLEAPPTLFRNIAREAGVHVYCETDDVIAADDSLIMIHASLDGRKKIQLPAVFHVTDGIHGNEIGVGIREFEVEMKKGETRIFLLKTSSNIH